MNIVILLLIGIVVISFIGIGKRARRAKDRKRDDKHDE